MEKPTGQISPEALSKLQKVFGKENITTFAERPAEGTERISSGSIALDNALGGGFPLGRIVEVFGPESSGKSSLCLHLLNKAQEEGHVCGYVDMEHSFDPAYAEALGVNIENLIISQPDYGEQAIDIVESMIKTNEVRVIIVDSTSTLTPKTELEGETGDQSMGLLARLLSKALRSISPMASKHNCLVVFISQMREKIGIAFGDPRVIGVGNAMKFYASIRLDVSKTSPIKDDNGNPVGHTMKFKTIKNKTFPPFRQAEIIFRYGTGFDTYSEILDLATQMQIVTKSGSWYAYAGTNIGQGSEKTIAMLKDNPELFEQITELVKANLQS